MADEHRRWLYTRAAVLLSGTWVVSTPCHERRVYVDERELGDGDRRVSVPCPRCSRIWVVTIAAPTARWAQ